jgi:hypothetical protein
MVIPSLNDLHRQVVFLVEGKKSRIPVTFSSLLEKQEKIFRFFPFKNSVEMYQRMFAGSIAFMKFIRQNFFHQILRSRYMIFRGEPCAGRMQKGPDPRVTRIQR